MPTAQQVNRCTSQSRIRQTLCSAVACQARFQQKNKMSPHFFQALQAQEAEIPKSIMDFLLSCWGAPVGFIYSIGDFGCPVGVNKLCCQLKAPPMPHKMLAWSPWFPRSGPGSSKSEQSKKEPHAKADRPGDKSEGATKLYLKCKGRQPWR